MPRSIVASALSALLLALGCGASTTTNDGGLDVPLRDGGPDTPSASDRPFVFTVTSAGSVVAYAVNPSDGSLAEVDSYSVGSGAGFIDVVSATGDVFVARSDEVVALRFDGAVFAELDRASTSGGGTHVNALGDASFVFLAHFNEGAMDVIAFDGSSFGGLDTFSPGIEAHQVAFSPDEQVAFVPCRNANWIAQYDVASGGSVTAAMPATVAAVGGPRHIELHPTLPVAYLLAEHASDVHVFDRDGADHLVAPPRQTIATRADGTDNQSSDLHLSATRDRLYAVNRTNPAVAELSVASDGSLSFLGTQPLQGVVRAFAVDPRGPHVYFGDAGGHLQRFERDAVTGRLVAHESLDGLGSIQATTFAYLPEP